jgi:hypothetical protein
MITESESIFIDQGLLQRLKDDPIRTYLLLKMLIEQYVKFDSPEGQQMQMAPGAIDYVLKGMMNEIKRQYPEVREIGKPKPEEIN